MGDHNLTATTRLSPPVDTSLPYDASTMAGKTVLITGAAMGIGAGIARHWASLGSNVMVGDINDAVGEKLVAELRTLHPGGSHHYFHCDVTDWDAQTAFFKGAARASPNGGIDVVVANAGVSIIPEETSFAAPEPSPEDPDAPKKLGMKTYEVNFAAAMYTLNLGMFWLPRNGGPNTLNPSRDLADGKRPPAPGAPKRDRCLILVGSGACIYHFTPQPLYTGSKHALMGVFRSLRGTAWLSGVRVNMICPNFVRGSGMFPPVAEAVMLAGTAGGTPMEVVVDAATRLAADESIVGRGLMIGPRMKALEGPRGEGVAEGEDDERGIWDCHAEDYVNSEAFIWRFVRMLNAAEKTRGWIGFWRDVFRIPGLWWRWKL